MSRGFAMFGCLFSIFECQMEKLRHKDDGINSFVAGGFTSMIVAA
jgi:import inner membrane translocase subunit TIM22